MKTVTRKAAAATAVAVMASSAVAGGAAYDRPVDIELTFQYHIDADMAEQDVFLERTAGSGEVFRALKSDRDLSQPLFASSEAQAHSPFDVNATGPFPKGAPLGMTLGEWFGAKGSGTYSCTDGKATVDVDFTGLVPNGVYTMWHFFTASPPTDPFNGYYDVPMGSRDGSDSVFTADDEGHVRLQRTFKPCLQLSGEHLMSGLAIAWHSDGKTYGPDPGELGYNSHAQMFLALPKRAGI